MRRPFGHTLLIYLALTGRLMPEPENMYFCTSLALLGYAFALILSGIHVPIPDVSVATAAAAEVAAFVVQGITALSFIGISILYVAALSAPSRRLKTLKSDKVFAVACLVALMLMVVLTLLEVVLLKPSLGHDRPVVGYEVLEHLGPLGWFLKQVRPSGSGSPSGFVMRQTVMSMAIVLLAIQPVWKKSLPELPAWALACVRQPVAYLFAVSTTFLVAAFRILSHAHDYDDVALGLVFGCLLFWWQYFVLALLLRGLAKRRADRISAYSLRFVVPGAFFSVLHLLASNNWQRWSAFSFTLLLILSIAYEFYILRISSRSEEPDRPADTARAILAELE